MLKVAFINMYGQSGLTQQKLLELENFIQKNKLDIVCLTETNISESTFMECNYIYKNFVRFTTTTNLDMVHAHWLKRTSV